MNCLVRRKWNFRGSKRLVLQNRNTSAHTGTLGSLLTSCNLRLSYLDDRLGGGGGGSNSKLRDMLKDFSAAAVRCALVITLIFYIFSFFSFFFFSSFSSFSSELNVITVCYSVLVHPSGPD